MPCGGIVPISQMDPPDLPLELRGPGEDDWCYQCFGAENLTHYCFEWDCFLHERCIDGFLKTPEGEIVLAHGHKVVR